MGVFAHGGAAGAVAEIGSVVVGLAVLGFLVWRGTKRTIDDHDPLGGGEGDGPRSS